MKSNKKKEKYAKLRKEFKKRIPLDHYSCEDGWYSCPKSSEGSSDDNKSDKCDCGAEEYRERLWQNIVYLLDQREKEIVKEIIKWAEKEVGREHIKDDIIYNYLTKKRIGVIT